jgi:hypothetical protein
MIAHDHRVGSTGDAEMPRASNIARREAVVLEGS